MAYTDHAEPLTLSQRVFVAYKKAAKLVLGWLPGNALRVWLMRRIGYRVGQRVYVGEGLIVTEILEDRSEKLVIGDRVAIAQRVTFVTASDPNWSRLADLVPAVRGAIRVGDDAWIGAGAIILPHTTIGEMSIVGAGAVVTKDVPPYAIVAGVPARVIGDVRDLENPREARPAG